MTTPDPEWVGGYHEAATYLGKDVTPRQVRRWVAERKLAYTKPGGGRVQFTRQQLDEFIARFTFEAVVRPEDPKSAVDLCDGSGLQ